MYEKEDEDIEEIRLEAIEVFGNEEKANGWLNHPSILLGNISPIDFVKRGGNDGKTEILRLLAEIRWGAPL